jgi:signal transduction histidine kinase
MQLNRLDEAKAFSDSSVAAGKALSNAYLVMDGYKVNADIMRRMRDIDGYSNYMALYLSQRDSLDQLQQVSVTRELEAKYQNQVKQAEIEVLLLEQQLLASNIRRQKNMRNGISFTLFVVVVFSVVLVNRFKVLNETRRQLDVEKLRNTIARDLHDDLGSTLSSINIISQMAAQNSQADAGSHFARIGKHSALMMDKLTDIVWSINPDNDNTDQLIAKMREFASEILEPKSIEWKFYVDKQICSLRPSIEKRKAIFMVFKEAINNAAKYSNAARVDVFIGINKGQFELKVRDKGKGFDEVVVKKGNGLRNMRERAKQAGGLVNINSKSGHGTEVLLQIPIT